MIGRDQRQVREPVGFIEGESLAGAEPGPAALVAEIGILTEQALQSEKSFMDGSAEDGIALDPGGEPYRRAGLHLFVSTRRCTRSPPRIESRKQMVRDG